MILGTHPRSAACATPVEKAEGAPWVTVFEPEAVAVHLEDVNVAGEAIEQCAGKPLGGQHGSSKGGLLVRIVEPRA